MNSDLKQQLFLIKNKANEALEDARFLLDLGRYPAAASRAYYAVFHILQAVLLTKELSFSKHAGVVSGFSRYFIRENIFPKDFAEKIRRLWKNREIGDYEYEKKITEAEARKCFEDAATILTAIQDYLANSNKEK